MSFGLVVVPCVCLSVPALAASASVETSNQRYLLVSLRLFLDFAKPCRPLACAVIHGLPRALARLPLTLSILGLLVESVVAYLASILILTLLQGSRAAQLAARPAGVN